MSSPFIKITEVTQRIADTNSFCHLAGKDNCIIVTDWYNGEGVDVSIERSGDATVSFSLTYGELQALNFLVNYPSVKNHA